MRGAEAKLKDGTLLSRKVVVKERMAKSYRVKELDERLRRERTRSEAKLLHKAKEAGVPAPIVMEVGEFSLTMTRIDGQRPAMDGDDCREAGRLLALLHKADIIHGDYTPANLIVDKAGKMNVIDFGLGFISKDIEDRAVDVFTMLRALRPLGKERESAFLEGYSSYPKAKSVIKRVAVVESRVRYAI